MTFILLILQFDFILDSPLTILQNKTNESVATLELHTSDKTDEAELMIEKDRK